MSDKKEEKERKKLNRKLLKRTFESEMKEKIQKYETQYMSIGMCFGVAIGLALGSVVFPDNMTLGMCFGLPIGMSIGLAIGQEKDRRLAENMMEISRIEKLAGYTDVFVYAVDKNGTEKEYRVTEKVMKAEKFAVGDRVAEEKEGVLVSLESK